MSVQIYSGSDMSFTIGGVVIPFESLSYERKTEALGSALPCVRTYEGSYEVTLSRRQSRRWLRLMASLRRPRPRRLITSLETLLRRAG